MDPLDPVDPLGPLASNAPGTSSRLGAAGVKSAPGFDKDHWPAMADQQWGATLHQFYEREPYWTVTCEVAESAPAPRVDRMSDLPEHSRAPAVRTPFCRR